MTDHIDLDAIEKKLHAYAKAPHWLRTGRAPVDCEDGLALVRAVRAAITFETLRDAFDAGARAMSNAMKRRRKPNWVWDTLKKDYTWDGKTYVSPDVRVDITKLPGRPETKENI